MDTIIAKRAELVDRLQKKETARNAYIENCLENYRRSLEATTDPSIEKMKEAIQLLDQVIAFNIDQFDEVQHESNVKWVEEDDEQEDEANEIDEKFKKLPSNKSQSRPGMLGIALDR